MTQSNDQIVIITIAVIIIMIRITNFLIRNFDKINFLILIIKLVYKVHREKNSVHL
jgi:hypothetical protein